MDLDQLYLFVKLFFVNKWIKNTSQIKLLLLNVFCLLVGMEGSCNMNASRDESVEVRNEYIERNESIAAGKTPQSCNNSK